MRHFFARLRARSVLYWLKRYRADPLLNDLGPVTINHQQWNRLDPGESA